MVTAWWRCSARKRSSIARRSPDAQQRLVDGDRGALVLEVPQRLEDDARRDPLGRGDEDDLVGAFDRKARERAGDAGAEIEQHHLVEAGQERDELAVAIGSQAGGQFGLSWRAEEVQPARQSATRTR